MVIPRRPAGSSSIIRGLGTSTQLYPKGVEEEGRSLGRVGVGHMVYISGLTCAFSSTNILEVSWREKEPGSLFVNLSLLSALLNSLCLHNLSPLSDLPRSTNRTHVYSSVHSLHLTIADDSADVLAWCVGQTDVEFLQISPDEYLELPEFCMLAAATVFSYYYLKLRTWKITLSALSVCYSLPTQSWIVDEIRFIVIVGSASNLLSIENDKITTLSIEGNFLVT
ncbi:hypothetical protein Zm00014a_013017 [Zea mays]|uniref:Cell division control protein 24 OB domain-containing protein n=1 Tax=Zea mays TaxID=4577 RepID=A0A3L6E1G1_MAIZE|nr:hypothetical protein Zm00014a_013017 [Zea mays]